ncbi:MAG: hypothetical protein AAF968_01360 [Pseudomonadota bacterium]
MAVAVADDPEARFRRLPAALRRWTPSALWRRLRLARRRERWMAENAAACAPYAKPAAADCLAAGPILAIGDFSGDNGISRAALYEHARLEAEARAAGLGPVERLDLTDPALPRHPDPRADGAPAARLYLLSAPDTYARALALVSPASIARARRTGLWVWETPVLGRDWHFAFDMVHAIWTPSAYSRQAIAAAAPPGVAVSLRPHTPQLPAGIAAPNRPALRAALRTALRARWGIAEDAFLGLAVMDIRSCPARKNPWAHVAAWAAAFGGRPDRVLILKLRLSKRTAIVRRELAEMIAAQPGGSSTIRVVEDFLPEAEMTALQAGADVYLSLHRAEGYGLNIHECLALGTPVVATDWSANAEYAPAYAGYHPVPYRLVPHRDWTGHYPDRDFLWAEADIAAAAETLQDLAAQREVATQAGGGAHKEAGGGAQGEAGGGAPRQAGDLPGGDGKAS